MKGKLALIMVLLLSGCQTVYKDRIVEVKVPVFEEPPAPAEVYKPELPIFNLAEDATSKDVARAAAESIKLLIGYSKDLEKSREPFLKKDPK